jgi:hypothetical protein
LYILDRMTTRRHGPRVRHEGCAVCCAALAAVVPAAIDVLGALREHSPALAGTASPAGFFDLFGLTGWNELGERYRHDDR